MKIRIGISSKF